MNKTNTPSLETHVAVANSQDNWTQFHVTVTNTSSIKVEAEACVLEVTASQEIIKTLETAWTELPMETHTDVTEAALTVTLRQTEEDTVSINPGESFIIGLDFKKGELIATDLPCTAFVETGQIQPTIPGYPSEHGALTVGENGRIQNQYGDDIQLMGMSFHGYSWFGDYVNPHSMANTRKVFNGNLIRIAIYTATDPIGTAYHSGGYLNLETDADRLSLRMEIKERIQEAIEADLYVIIDWHLLDDFHYGFQPFPSLDVPEPLPFGPEEWKAAAIEFFTDMADTFKNIPNVIFELFNEPNYSTPDNSPGAPTYSWIDIKPTAISIMKAIRKEGAGNLIVVGTPSWCQNLIEARENPITDDDNHIYALHFYANEHFPEPGQWVYENFLEATKNGFPTFVSEFGTTPASGDGEPSEPHTRSWLEALNAQMVSYANWSLSDQEEKSAALDVNTQPAPESWTESNLSASGIIIRDCYAQKYNATKRTAVG